MHAGAAGAMIQITTTYGHVAVYYHGDAMGHPARLVRC